MTIGELVDELADQAFGLGLLAFMLPLCLPMPPGVHTVAGGVLMIVATQLILGRERLWLPLRLRALSVRTQTMRRGVAFLERYIGFVDRLTCPRWTVLTGREGRRAVGLVMAVLALIMMLPIPIMGNLPPALAICVLALGMAERDGLVLSFGLVAAALATAFTSTLTVATVRGLIHLFG